MRLVVSCEQRYVRTPDGRVWSTTGGAYDFWQRYLPVFAEVRIVARVAERPGRPPDAQRVDGDHVTVHAVLNLVPGRAQPPLAQWLVDRYAPGSASGYGFSLTGEAYLNYGFWGIPALFAGLTVAHRLLINRIDRAPVYAYGSVLFTVAWMYGFRGESAGLLKTCVYGLVFYGVLRLVTVRVTVRVPAGGDEEVARECVSS